MEAEIALHIVIDWGYTYLKLWAIKSNNKIVSSQAICTKELNSDPSFYSVFEIINVANIINEFCSSVSNDDGLLEFSLSSQMHGLAGYLEHGEPFFSTWNDLPVNKNCGLTIDTFLGIPLLSSMPFYKLEVQRNNYWISTEAILNRYQKKRQKINCFGTPLQVVMNCIANFKLDASTDYWQSTCLPAKYIKQHDNSTFKANINYIKSSLAENSQIIVHSEIGDLQASTCTAIKESDIVINLGTGSQVIFKPLTLFPPNFYRIYKNIGKVGVISHIPCGRLLADYCMNNKMAFDELIDTISQIDYNSFRYYITQNTSGVLYFPGYNANILEYTNNPIISLFEISKFPKEVILCSWLNQYILILNELILKEDFGKDVIKIFIVGELGGLSDQAMRLMKELIPEAFILYKTNETLPISIVKDQL